MSREELRSIILEVVEEVLRSQLAAIRRLRSPEPLTRNPAPLSQKGMSIVDMTIDILKSSGEPVHVNEIIRAVEERFDRRVDRESLVSALAKRMARGGIERVAPNTFRLGPGPQNAPGGKNRDDAQ